MPAELIAALEMPDLPPQTANLRYSCTRLRTFLTKYAQIKEDDELRIYWVKAKIEADCFGMVFYNCFAVDVTQDKLHGINVSQILYSCVC
jgi:hypothetical protein